jgi:hypothetical protein
MLNLLHTSTVSTLILCILAVDLPQCSVGVNRYTDGMSPPCLVQKSPRHYTYSFSVDTIHHDHIGGDIHAIVWCKVYGFNL